MTIIQSGGRAVMTRPSPQARLREAVTEVSRALEDFNWQNLSTDWRTEGDRSFQDRKRDLRRIRTFRRRNPLAKQAASLLLHYVVGQGVSYKVENKKIVARLMDEFWGNTVNERVLTSHSGQKWFLDKCFTDGEFFLLLFPDEEAGTVEMGYLDAMFVDDVINDEQNSLVPKWYKVAKPEAKFNFNNGTWEPSTTSNDFIYYRDWRNDDPAPAGADMAEGLVYHIMPERNGKRGESQLAAALDWLKVHQEFMGDRATMNRAAAQVAWKKKRKAGASDVAAEVQRLRSTLAQSVASWEQNPAPASGSTIVENEGTSLEWVKTDTGAQAASADERTLRMMAGSGMGGIPNHYFGDEANANLATATAMELPLLKTYEDWQTFFRDVLDKVTEFMLQVANKAGRVPDRDDSKKYQERVTTMQGAVAQDTAVQEAFTPFTGNTDAMAGGMKLVMVPKPGAATAQPTALGGTDSNVVSWYIDFDFAPILQKEIGATLLALTQFLAMLPGENIESQKLVVEMALTVFGVNDLDQVMTRLYPDDMVAVLVPNRPPMQVGPDGKPIAPPKQVGPGAPPDAAVATKEALPEGAVSLAEHRTRRLLRLARHVDEAAADG